MGVASAGFEGTSICCAYVPGANAKISNTLLRSSLASTLPGYMLPSRWLALDALPKNVNGKVDYPRLRELFGQAPPGANGAA